MITSDKNPKISLVRALAERTKDRKKHNAFIVEGVRLMEELFQANWSIQFILYSDSLSERGLQLVNAFGQKGTECDEIPYALMKKLTDTEAPQGILAVVTQPIEKTPEHLDFALICDNIRDPGNLGTILRTAAAADVQMVLITPGTTDPFAPKVVRSAMGAHFHIPIQKLSIKDIHAVCKNRPKPLTIYMATADAGLTCYQANLKQPTAILVGSEAFGPSDQSDFISDFGISIPMPGKSESLNAAVAASILLFETVRQRST